jgi:hypothetical protein
MGSLQEFSSALDALTESDSPSEVVELLPSRIASVVRAQTSADAVGLSVTDRLRIPLGTAGVGADAAERIQVTLGVGPCLAALDADAPVAFTDADISSRWPVFHQMLTERTSLRSVVSIPLRGGNKRFGAIDAYFSHPEAASGQTASELAELAGHVAGTLLVMPPSVLRPGIAGPGWLASDSARRRMVVWQAAGLIATAMGSDSSDAIAVLRAAAFSHGTDLDVVAAEVVSRRLDADALLEG